MKIVNFALLILLFLSVAFGDKCCEICPKGTAKFYQIDRSVNKCSEFCLKPIHYRVINHFEKTLKRSFTGNPCVEKGFIQYESTVTQQYLSVKTDVDKYIKI